MKDLNSIRKWDTTKLGCFIDKTQVTRDENKTSKALASSPVLVDPNSAHIIKLVSTVSHSHTASLLGKSLKNQHYFASSNSFEITDGSRRTLYPVPLLSLGGKPLVISLFEDDPMPFGRPMPFFLKRSSPSLWRQPSRFPAAR